MLVQPSNRQDKIFYNGQVFSPGPLGWSLQELRDVARQIWFVAPHGPAADGGSDYPLILSNLQALEQIMQISFPIIPWTADEKKLKASIALQYFLTKYEVVVEKVRVTFVLKNLGNSINLSDAETTDMIRELIADAASRGVPDLKERLLFIVGFLRGESILKQKLKSEALKLDSTDEGSSYSISGVYDFIKRISANENYTDEQKLKIMENTVLLNLPEQSVMYGKQYNTKEKIALLSVALHYFLNKHEIVRPEAGLEKINFLLTISDDLSPVDAARALQDVFVSMSHIKAGDFLVRCEHLRSKLSCSNGLTDVLEQVTLMPTTSKPVAKAIVLHNQINTKKDEEQNAGTVLHEVAENNQLPTPGMAEIGSPTSSRLFRLWSPALGGVMSAGPVHAVSSPPATTASSAHNISDLIFQTASPDGKVKTPLSQLFKMVQDISANKECTLEEKLKEMAMVANSVLPEQVEMSRKVEKGEAKSALGIALHYFITKHEQWRPPSELRLMLSFFGISRALKPDEIAMVLKDVFESMPEIKAVDFTNRCRFLKIKLRDSSKLTDVLEQVASMQTRSMPVDNAIALRNLINVKRLQETPVHSSLLPALGVDGQKENVANGQQVQNGAVAYAWPKAQQSTDNVWLRGVRPQAEGDGLSKNFAAFAQMPSSRS